MFAQQSPEGAEKIIATTQSALEDDMLDQGKVHTLKEFSIDHFRPPPKRTLSRTLSKSGFKRKGDELWNYTRVSVTPEEHGGGLIRSSLPPPPFSLLRIQSRHHF